MQHHAPCIDVFGDSNPVREDSSRGSQGVWRALLTIPYGETRTYAQIAEQLGRPTATRAVGAANGRNPISIITPCHRVIGSNGRLTGFAGGLAAKQYLLDLESRQSLPAQPHAGHPPRPNQEISSPLY